MKKTLRSALSLLMCFLMSMTTLVFFNPFHGETAVESKAANYNTKPYSTEYYYPAGTWFVKNIAICYYSDGGDARRGIKSAVGYHDEHGTHVGYNAYTDNNCGAGYVDIDLNKGCGKKSKYVYFSYTMTQDPAAANACKGIRITHNEDEDSYIAANSRSNTSGVGWYKCNTGDNGTYSPKLHVDGAVDLNKGVSKSDDMKIYATYDRAFGPAISAATCTKDNRYIGSSSWPGWRDVIDFRTGTVRDVNQGAGGDDLYLHFYSPCSVVNSSTLRSVATTASNYIDSANYTAASMNTLKNAYNKAVSIINDLKDGYTTSNQTTINNAATALQNALNSLQTNVYLKGTTNGGNRDWNATVTIGTKSSVAFNVSSYAPSKSNYTFIGWSTGSNATSGSKSTVTVGFNQTIYAIYSAALTGTFHYIANGSHTSKNVTTTIYNNTSSGTVTAPVNIGSTVSFDGRTFTLKGWRPDAAAAAPTLTANSYTHSPAAPNKTYYAIYESPVTLTYNINGGTVNVPSESKTQILNASPSLDRTAPTFTMSSVDPKREGSDRLLGWSTTQARAEAEQVDYGCGQSYSFSADTTVYAAHYLHRWVVRFHFDGEGSRVIKTETVRYGKSATAPANPLKNSDDDNEFYFNHWDKAYNNVKSDLEVYAIYDEVAHDWVKVDVSFPTCTETGLQHWTCKNKYRLTGELCGYERDVVIPANGHDIIILPGKDPTCTEKGYTADKRCQCGYIEQASEEIPALGHDWGEFVETESDCKTNGVKVRRCKRCGAEDLETKVVKPLDPTKHEIIPIPAVAVTCTSNGSKEGSKCDRCGAIIKQPDVIISEGHVWDVTPAVAPTCTTPGSTVGKVCSICGTVGATVETIPATDHNYIEIGAKDPTCTEPGNTPGFYCTKCGDGNVTFVDALGHDFEDVKVTKEATCTEEGLKEGGCKRCGEGHVEEIIPKLPHTPEVIPAVEATCSSFGYTEGEKCSVCGTVTVEPQKIKKLDHTWEKTDDGKPATCTENGVTAVYKCSVCGEEKGGNIIVKLKHDFSDWVVTKVASCGVGGEKVRRCRKCDILETEIIPAFTHNFVFVEAVAPTCTSVGYTDGTKCEICGLVETGIEEVAMIDHDFETVTVPATCSENGTETVTCTVCGKTTVTTLEKLNHPAESEVVIPATAPTCTRAGKTEGRKCGVCGEIIVKQNNIEPTDHREISYGSNEAATCSAYGSKAGVICADCGKITVKAKELAPIEHTYSDWTVAKEATCTEFGEKVRVCTGCGDVQVKFTPAYGHTYGPMTVVTEPTCTEKGKAKTICTRCLDEIDYEIPAKGHTGVVVDEIPATCETDGVSAGMKCADCGEVLMGLEPIEKLGHDYVMTHVTGDCETDECDLYICKNDPSHMYRENVVKAPGHQGGNATCLEEAVCTVCNKTYGEKGAHKYEKTVIAPTCVADGYTVYVCTVCGDEYKGDNKPATGEHSFVRTVVTKAPSCTEAGEAVERCTACGIERTVAIDAKGHSVSEWTVEGNEAKGKCSDCGETVTRPATSDDIKPCDRCGYRHTRTTGLFKYKGVFCSITYFFRQLAKFFKGGK